MALDFWRKLLAGTESHAREAHYKSPEKIRGAGEGGGGVAPRGRDRSGAGMGGRRGRGCTAGFMRLLMKPKRTHKL